VAASLSTSIGTLTLERPTILASGILGISLNIFERLYRAGAGAVVTKSLSKEPWDGYANPTIFSVKGGGWLNAVGLSNPGAPNFAKMITSNKDVPIIVSLVGSVEDDFDFMVKQFENCKVSAYELNLSCPHVAKVGLEVGDDVELVKKIVKKVKSLTDVPVIAKVHGAAYAAGCQLAASCDLAYSTNEATFATPGVNIGLFCSTPMVAVSRKVNRKRTMRMLLTGDPISAKYAKEIGLINDHFSKSKINREVFKVAKKISSKSNLIIKIGKKAFYKQLEMPLNKAYSYTSKIMTQNMMALDAKEGISAFLEKRKPKWKNK